MRRLILDENRKRKVFEILEHLPYIKSNEKLLLQNVEKVMHIKGRQLDQAMILFICEPLQMRTSLKGKNLLPEFAPRGSKFFPL